MTEKRQVQITTIDNPFDPFDDFDNWFYYDIEKGYYTCSKLARLAEDREDLSSYEEEQEFERIIDRLIEIDPLKIYKKVEKITKINEKTQNKTEKE